MKKCAHCGVSKDYSNFADHGRYKDGLNVECKSCQQLTIEQKRLKRKADRAAWYQKNKDRIVKVRNMWRTHNRQKYLDYLKKFRQDNREYYLNYCRTKRAVDPDFRLRERIRAANRHAKKSANGGRHSIQDIRDLFAEQQGKCAACNVSIDAYFEVDHRMPVCLGGHNAKENLQLLCRLCNRRKSGKHPDVWREELKRAA